MGDSNDTKSDYDIALERIAAEAEARTGKLDLRWLNIETLPNELGELTHLTELLLGSPYFDDVGEHVGKNRSTLRSLNGLESLANLQTLRFSNTQVRDLAPLKNIGNLQALYCDDTQVSDLSPLIGLTALKRLDCDDTPIRDLAALSSLTDLQRLDCDRTQVTDLAPLSDLIALQTLYCSSTQISDLAPLSGLTALQTLYCNSTQISDLAPLGGLTALQKLYCNNTQVSDLAPLSSLTDLQELNCDNTQVSNLAPLSSLTALQRLDCDNTQVSDLAPLSGLIALQTLYCNSTQISNLTPLSGLTNLRELYFNQTQVCDLTPLSSLTALQNLYCDRTRITDLAPLSSLTALQTLCCGNTQITDLTPLRGLTVLQMLFCDNTQISDLAPLNNLTALQELNCDSTQISDIAPLSGLTALQVLYCNCTQISDLAPLSGLTNLTCLDCSNTLVRDASVIADLPRLVEATFDGCHFDTPKIGVLESFCGHLYLYQTRMQGVPNEVLSQREYTDCRDSLFAHLSDVEAGHVSHNQCKLIVLGNGRVGKTQICRQLRGEAYDPSVPSTHGITVTTAKLNDDRTLNLWDFGGQDIYHGTHGLFMRTRAIFLIAWTPTIEGAMTQTQGDYVFRNYPLAYWLDYVRELSGTELPVVIVQTQCDSGQDAVYSLPHIGDRLDPFSDFKPRIVQFSALTGFRRPMLDESLGEAFAHIQERFGASVIGKGRLTVLEQLEAMRDEDADRDEDRRLYRTVSRAQFEEMCANAGNISSTKHFLHFLHNSGVVFYREGLFNDEIVLDQGWALNAIYTVFDRDNCLHRIRRFDGRFQRDLLAELVWGKYSRAEQELFLSMMVTCGICFVHRRGDTYGDTEYIAPDLLPDKTAVARELNEKWDDSKTSSLITLIYPLLHDGLMRSVLSRLGTEAGMNGLYWKGGICLFEHNSRSHAMIEQHMTGDWRGEIRVRTQDDPRNELLGALRDIVQAEAEKIGLKHEQTDAAPTHAPRTDPDEPPPPAPLYVTPPHSGRKWYVSYAWGDNTPEGRARDEAVEGVQAKGRSKGIEILRDKDRVRFGDSLSKFMLGLTRGERIFVILSDKYLKSPACMYEFYEIWRTLGQDPDRFKDAIRAYALPCARIFDLEGRAGYALYWAAKHKNMAAMIEEHGSDFLGVSGFQEHRLNGELASHITDILKVIADTWQPRELDDFYTYAFD